MQWFILSTFKILVQYFIPVILLHAFRKKNCCSNTSTPAVLVPLLAVLSWVFLSLPPISFLFKLPHTDYCHIVHIVAYAAISPFKEMNLEAARSAQVVLSAESASGHGCFSQKNHSEYMNHCLL